MTSKKNSGHRERKPKDLADKSKTFKLRNSQIKRIKDLPYGHFSSFISKIFDEHFANKDLLEGVDDKELSYISFVSFIGSGIDVDDTFKCLIAWLENEPLNKVSIKKSYLSFYEKILQHETAERKDSLIHDCKEVIDHVRVKYFLDRYLHYSSFSMYRIIQKTSDKTTVSSVETHINNLAGIESRQLWYLVFASPIIRFATYVCHQHLVLTTPATQPDWLVAVDPEVLRAMDCGVPISAA